MLIPKRVKHRKQFRGRMKGRAMRGNTVAHGEFGLAVIGLSGKILIQTLPPRLI